MSRSLAIHSKTLGASRCVAGTFGIASPSLTLQREKAGFFPWFLFLAFRHSCNAVDYRATSAKTVYLCTTEELQTRITHKTIPKFPSTKLTTVVTHSGFDATFKNH